MVNLFDVGWTLLTLFEIETILIIDCMGVYALRETQNTTETVNKISLKSDSM